MFAQDTALTHKLLPIQLEADVSKAQNGCLKTVSVVQGKLLLH
jgi:hypothetical protein